MIQICNFNVGVVQIPKCHHVPVRRLGAILTSEDYVRYFRRRQSLHLRYLPAPNKDWHFKIQKKSS